MKRLMVVLTVAGLLLAVLSGAAMAQTAPQGALDANNLDDDALGGAGTNLNDAQSLAQTFTAVRSGTITGAQVGLGKILFNSEFDIAAFNVTASITEVDSSGAPANVLASTTIPGSAVTGTAFEPALVNMTFENPPEVIAGQKYALTLTSNVPDGIENGYFLLETTGGQDSYSGGTLFNEQLRWSPPGTWNVMNEDSIFAIYAAPGPLAATKTVPKSNAAGVAPTTNVKAYFNHDMRGSTVTPTTFKIRKQGTTTWLGATRSVNNTISPTSTNGGSQSVITLNPNADLVLNTTYQVVVVGGSSGVKDVSGEALSSNKSWIFTTGATPPDTTINSGPPSLDNSLSTSFSFSSSKANSSFECSLDGASFGPCPSPVGEPEKANYSNLSEGSHHFRVRAIDATGNIDPTPASRSWTVDSVAPTANNVSPENGATNVSLAANVTATFSEAMNSSSISGQTFTVSKSGSPVSAQVTYDENSRTATLNPDQDLQADTTYDAKITTSVKDPAGNAMVQEKTWSFTTASNPGGSVTVTPNPLDFGSACLTTITKSVTITNNTASQVDVFPSVTHRAFSVASGELHIASGQSLDLPISWGAGGAFKWLDTGRLELKNAAGNTIATSDLKGLTFCSIDG